MKKFMEEFKKFIMRGNVFADLHKEDLVRIFDWAQRAAAFAIRAGTGRVRTNRLTFRAVEHVFPPFVQILILFSIAQHISKFNKKSYRNTG